MPRAVPRAARAGRDAAGSAGRSPGSSRPASGAPRPPRVPRPSAGGSRPAPFSVRRLPNPRLTGLGSGLFGSAVMLALGGLDILLFGASLTVYGVLFLPVCVLTALWVRPGDLPAPPVVMPIAFAVGVLPVADGGDGAAARLMGLVTALATQAGWLYAGTLAAAVTILVRGVRRATARRRAATAQAVRRPR
ncbi:hypothetical protein JCM4814A_24860 [Streptomyces phaeofaciens JCM 4814]|uniref:DUF6542 domain-containing protein n=1 Tax=Streptomyces phaeofaciens TaxID=68254 RepID=A0A918H424_9ACTN|nr:DUF6542 domain-containing protein [Streptomyces phaeofaciens]GGT35985.1 hypothetical protein GCM10010226_10190 [Streptomyces phaeofaciens]